MTRIREINSEKRSVGIDHFYDIYAKKKRRYPPSFFCVSKPSKKKRKIPVDHIVYKKIVLEYLKLYFFDLYTSKQSLYFPLGGFIKKVMYPKWKRVMANGVNGSQGSIGLFWYNRPSSRMFYMVKLKKLTGSSNRLPKLEERLKNIINKDLIPIFKPELRKKKETKSLYLCTLTSSPSRKS